MISIMTVNEPLDPQERQELSELKRLYAERDRMKAALEEINDLLMRLPRLGSIGREILTKAREGLGK